MDRLPFPIDPNDFGSFGVSLANNAEVMVACMEAAGVRSVAEVGAYAGDLTHMLLTWAERAGARVVAIDPEPQPPLVRLEAEHTELELVRELSLDALQHLETTDAVIIDGDHNWHTVTEELRLIAERAPDGELPLLLFHDVTWPHARRDDYFYPEAIPADRRQPTRPGTLLPDEPGLVEDGIPYRWPAEREGGPRNGVLTAVEDFVAEHDGARLAVVPTFFGLGVVWHEDAPWASEVAAVLEVWDRHPLLERLEANRVHHVARSWALAMANTAAGEAEQRKDAVLEKLLESRSFRVAEAVSRLRGRGEPAISRERLRQALRR